MSVLVFPASSSSPLRCAVCEEDITLTAPHTGPLLATPMQNYTSVGDFLIQYRIAPGPLTQGSNLCCKCFALAQTCDELLSMFWSNVNGFRVNRERMNPPGQQDQQRNLSAASGPAPLPSPRRVQHTLIPPGTPASGQSRPHHPGHVFDPNAPGPSRGLGVRQPPSGIGIGGSVINHQDRGVQMNGCANEHLRHPTLDADIKPELYLFDKTCTVRLERLNLDQAAAPADPLEDPLAPSPFGQPSVPKRPRLSDPMACVECPFSAKNKFLLHVHYRKEHFIPGGFFCSECGRSFPTQLLFDAHWETHAFLLRNKVSCIDCRIPVETMDMAAHFGSAHGNVLARSNTERERLGRQYWNCPLCRFYSPSFLLYQLHLSDVHPCFVTFDCIHCRARFEQQRDLEYHLAAVHPRTTGRGGEDLWNYSEDDSGADSIGVF